MGKDKTMLKLATGTINVKMTLEEANEYNELVKRNTAKAVKKYVFDSGYTDFICPVCERITINDYEFCPRCGQRLDTSNIAL